jgi:hypothetical protein
MRKIGIVIVPGINSLERYELLSQIAKSLFIALTNQGSNPNVVLQRSPEDSNKEIPDKVIWKRSDYTDVEAELHEVFWTAPVPKTREERREQLWQCARGLLWMKRPKNIDLQGMQLPESLSWTRHFRILELYGVSFLFLVLIATN